MVACGSPSEFNYCFFNKNGFLIKILRDECFEDLLCVVGCGSQSVVIS